MNQVPGFQPPNSPSTPADALTHLALNADIAAELLKALAHKTRLLLLGHLIDGEKTVTEMEELLDLRQSAVSQQLSRLRFAGLVQARRDGKAMYYSLADERLAPILVSICAVFSPDQPQTKPN